MAALADGGFVVAWGVVNRAAKYADFTYDIYAQRFAVDQRADTVGITAASAAMPEGDADATTTFTFDVTLGARAAAPQSVRWHVEGSGADAADFEGGALPSGTLHFVAGESRKTVTVRVSGDALVEADEGFAVRLSDPSAGLTIATASAGATIANDDAPPPPVVPDEPSVVRGTAGDDVLVPAPGVDLYDGLGGRDALGMGHLGFRGAVVVAQANGDTALAHSGETCVLRGVEEARFADGRLVFDADDPAARVLRLYGSALDRLPDQDGLNFWIDAVRDGRPLADLARGFLASAEFQARFGDAAADNGAFVDRLYLDVLGREAEAEGRRFWVDKLDTGAAGRAEVLAAVSEGSENKAAASDLVERGIWDRSEAAMEVARLYDTVLGRRPDAPGLASWTDALEGGAATREGMAGAFVGGAEFRARYGALDDRGFIEALYENALDRPADRAGLDFWVARLEAGVGRSGVALGFSESAEHIALAADAIGGEDPSRFGVLFA